MTVFVIMDTNMMQMEFACVVISVNMRAMVNVYLVMGYKIAKIVIRMAVDVLLAMMAVI
jgi:hypothetical protein